MVTRRAAKSKGSSFEYDCQHSLKSLYPDIYLTKERGFQMQYDLRSDKAHLSFECKRLRGISWNQAKKYLVKLHSKIPTAESLAYLLVKTNHQPCLVAWLKDTEGEGVMVMTEFEDYFGVPFEKHPSTRSK